MTIPPTPRRAAGAGRDAHSRLQRCELTVDGLLAGLATLRKEIQRLQDENAGLRDELAREQARGPGVPQGFANPLRRAIGQTGRDGASSASPTTTRGTTRAR